jgi:hypothetical protein
MENDASDILFETAERVGRFWEDESSSLGELYSS